jgi:hypothetical protein
MNKWASVLAEQKLFREVPMATNYMKKHSTSLAIKEMQIKSH